MNAGTGETRLGHRAGGARFCASVVLVFALAFAACARGPQPAPEVSTTPLPPAAITAPARSAEVEAVVTEVAEAIAAARGVREALAQASADPSWDRVDRVCTAYPLGAVDSAFGVRLKEGFHARSTRPNWWPEEVVAVDSVAAVTCFVTGAAHSIPPNTRIDDSGPTTAEIAAQGLNAALEELGDASLPALRSQVEQRSASGT